jgi:hypothetical protein
VTAQLHVCQGLEQAINTLGALAVAHKLITNR